MMTALWEREAVEFIEGTGAHLGRDFRENRDEIDPCRCGNGFAFSDFFPGRRDWALEV
jgi:hypothetical protein